MHWAPCCVPGRVCSISHRSTQLLESPVEKRPSLPPLHKEEDWGPWQMNICHANLTCVCLLLILLTSSLCLLLCASLIVKFLYVLITSAQAPMFSYPRPSIPSPLFRSRLLLEDWIFLESCAFSARGYLSYILLFNSLAIYILLAICVGRYWRLLLEESN